MGSNIDPMKSGMPLKRAYGGVSVEERRRERRERLLEASLEVFGNNGLRQVTMRDITTKARLTDRYFYESFDNVHEAFEAVYAKWLAQLVYRLRLAISTSQPNQTVEAGLRVFFKSIKDDPRYARIIVDAVALRYANLGQANNSKQVFSVKPYIELFDKFIRERYPGISEIDVDMEFVLKNLISMTEQSAAEWVEQGFKKSSDDIVRHNLFAWWGLDHWVRSMLATANCSVPTS